MPHPSRAARLLTRPVLVVPIALVVLAVVAFYGYGAWTRSKPLHYSRGGDAFAVVPFAVTTPSSTPTRSAAPGLTPSATGTPRQAAVTATTAPSLSAQPVRTAKPAVALPRVGRYGLHVDGSEKVDFGPLSFCSQDLPASTALVVQKAAGEGPTSFDFDLPYFPGSSGRHDERHVYRYAPDAVFLDYEIATVTCQGVRQSSETSYSPPQLRVRLPLAVGRSWTSNGGDSDRTERTSTKVLRTQSLLVQGERVTTYVISTSSTFTGSESGTRSQTWWWSPRFAMPVKWSEHIDGHRSGAAYSEDVTVTVTSHP